MTGKSRRHTLSASYWGYWGPKPRVTRCSALARFAKCHIADVYNTSYRKRVEGNFKTTDTHVAAVTLRRRFDRGLLRQSLHGNDDHFAHLKLGDQSTPAEVESKRSILASISLILLSSFGGTGKSNDDRGTGSIVVHLHGVRKYY